MASTQKTRTTSRGCTGLKGGVGTASKRTSPSIKPATWERRPENQDRTPPGPKNWVLHCRNFCSSPPRKQCNFNRSRRVRYRVVTSPSYLANEDSTGHDLTRPEWPGLKWNDTIEQIVSWNSPAQLTSLGGTPTQLCFVWKHTQFWSFNST